MSSHWRVLLLALFAASCARTGTVAEDQPDTLVFNPNGPGPGTADARGSGDGGPPADGRGLTDADGFTATDGFAVDHDEPDPDAGDTAGWPEEVEEPDLTTVEVNDEPCLYVPEVGQFQPVLECYWDDPLEYTKYNDVVMTPVVANLTDDNFDGVIDLKDIPDIAFLTYRYEEDGCCKNNSVLRVVSGSCQSGITGQGTDAQLLHEHFHISQPKLDNSSGLAIGDIDGDGLADIVGMTNTTGTVAFSGVEYELSWPEQTAAVPAPWSVQGGEDAATVLTGPALDETGLVTASESGDPLLLTAPWGGNSAALATVRIELWARAPGGAANLVAVVGDGAATAQSEAQALPPGGEEFTRLVFEFRRNPLDGGIQWTDDAVAGLQFGFARAGPAGASVEVTRIDRVVGQVELKWQNPEPQGDNLVTAAQPAIADLDKDGLAEVVVGRVVLNGTDGTTRWIGTGDVGVNSFFGPISLAADVNLDGLLEVVAGGTLYNSEGGIDWQQDFSGEGTGCKKDKLPCDGFNAVGNFDQDEYGEVVVVRSGVVYVLEHNGDRKFQVQIPKINCAYNEGGPPTVADFDGDGFPEIGVAGADYYVVFDLDCCADLPDCAALPDPAPGCLAPGIRWQVANEDCSSRVTGSSVFDFDGDGQAEVVYNDETTFRILAGATGDVLFEKPNTSHTRLEYALVADTDNDANAEIVIVENGRNNPDPTPLQLWGDAYDNWVPTRRIWNQHTYHITNITEDGLQPVGGEEPNWLTYNNFRQNLPDYDPFLAPDLVPHLLPALTDGCPATLTLRAEVCNLGQLWVPPGIAVTFFDATTGTPLGCAEAPATTALLEPGNCQTVGCATAPAAGLPSWPISVCVDGFEPTCTGPGLQNECHEDNNLVTGTANNCP